MLLFVTILVRLAAGTGTRIGKRKVEIHLYTIHGKMYKRVK